METSPPKSRPSLAFGVVLILVAAFFLFFAKDIPRTGLAGNTDPGPRALPVTLAILVALGGLTELLRETLFRRRPIDAESNRESFSAPAETIAPARPAYANAVAMAAAVLVYLAALSWLGFQLSTVLFCLVVLVCLGARWWSALLAGVAIVLIVRILFVGLFHVQLPAGAFGLAF